MNICFLIYNISRSGGSERVTCIIADNLSKMGYNVHILSICGTNKPYYKVNKKVHFSTIYNKNQVNHKLIYLQTLHKIKKYYKDNKIHCSIDVFASMSLYTIPLKKFVKIKNISWEHFNYLTNEGMGKIARKLACKYSDAIVTLTKEDLNYYKANKKINGLAEYIHNPTPFPNALKCDIHSHKVITVGRLTYQKGYDMLLQAWKQVETKCNNWSLNIYGVGEDEEKLKKQAQDLNLKHVFFGGAVKNIAKKYEESSIYVSSSRFEGLPMCMIEAASFCLPIVGFNCKTGPSEIVENNVNGFLIDNFDIDKLSEKLIELILDEKKRISFSKKTTISKFSLSEIMKKWEMLLNELEIKK